MKEKEPDKDLVERANKLRNGYFGNDNTLPIDIARFAQEVRDEIQEKLEDDFDDGYSAICKKLEAERKGVDEQGPMGARWESHGSSYPRSTDRCLVIGLWGWVRCGRWWACSVGGGA